MEDNFERTRPLNFLEEIIESEISKGIFKNGIITRFPPEPNGFLHIGHAKSIVLNFGLSKRFGGKTNLRFDDTNPEKENDEYVQSIKKDINWLGYSWDNEFYASNYFDKLYDFAINLIQKNLAYVDDSSPEEIAKQKGTPTTPGVNSPFRNRSIEENLDLFMRMKLGEFRDGEKVLRAKIDMAHPNMHMRDPLMYRIKRAHHHRTGDKWCIYPMYDFAHGQSDSIENITHSICTLEFDVHRPLYNWFIENLEIYPSRQFEFARLNLSHTVMSKRKLLKLVEQGIVDGWDDPRMPTISGFRRRGFTPESIRVFCDKIGVAKRDNLIDYSLLEYCIREDLNKKAQRLMAVLDPIKVTILNYPENKTEDLPIENNPENPESGTRLVPFGREIYIERDDFELDPPKKYFRLAPGLPVRLKGAYIIEYVDSILDADGNVKEIMVNYLENSKSGQDESGIKVKGTIHWVETKNAQQIQVKLLDRLLITEDSSKLGDNFLDFINKESLIEIKNAYIEPEGRKLQIEDSVQFVRKGYFCLDKNSSEGSLIFNRTATLKDTWAKLQTNS